MKFFVISLTLTLGANLIYAQENIYKSARVNSYNEFISYSASPLQDKDFKVLFQYIDSFPVQIYDSLIFNGYVFGKVGIPIGQLDSSNIASFFSIPTSRNETVLYNKKIDSWKGYFMIYFAFDIKRNKFYKLDGFRNYDVIELIDDLMKFKMIKNRKAFLNRVVVLEEINFLRLIKLNCESYNFGVLQEKNVIISTDENGRDHHRIER